MIADDRGIMPLYRHQYLNLPVPVRWIMLSPIVDVEFDVRILSEVDRLTYAIQSFYHGLLHSCGNPSGLVLISKSAILIINNSYT